MIAFFCVANTSIEFSNSFSFTTITSSPVLANTGLKLVLLKAICSVLIQYSIADFTKGFAVFLIYYP